MARGYSREHTSVHLLNYHFVWCPKYRKKILKEDIKNRLEELIQEKAEELELEILELSIQPDHVHLFIEGSPKLSPNKIIQQIKGYTSRELNKDFEFTQLPSLWTRSYFVSSAGNVSNETIQKYIEEQTGV